MAETTPSGKVVLAGAGPGDPELITLKLMQRLQEADVIITDRLVHPAILKTHARPDARIIRAGKQGYNQQSYTQEEVTALLVQEALQGKNVLRLKGGDVAFFSNVLDELFALEQHGIPFEIVPGVTAASGASAYTGIPLTARGYAQGVRFIAYNPDQQYDTTTWVSLAVSTETLVIYMAGKTLPDFARQLLDNGADPGKPVAVIEQASTLAQQTHFSELGTVQQDFKEKEFSSPSLVIMGDVLRLQGRFSWFRGGEQGTVFPGPV